MSNSNITILSSIKNVSMQNFSGLQQNPFEYTNNSNFMKKMSNSIIKLAYEPLHKIIVKAPNPRKEFKTLNDIIKYVYTVNIEELFIGNSPYGEPRLFSLYDRSLRNNPLKNPEHYHPEWTEAKWIKNWFASYKKNKINHDIKKFLQRKGNSLPDEIINDNKFGVYMLLIYDKIIWLSLKETVPTIELYQKVFSSISIEKKILKLIKQVIQNDIMFVTEFINDEKYVKYLRSKLDKCNYSMYISNTNESIIIIRDTIVKKLDLKQLTQETLINYKEDNEDEIENILNLDEADIPVILLDETNCLTLISIHTRSQQSKTIAGPAITTLIDYFDNYSVIIGIDANQNLNTLIDTSIFNEVHVCPCNKNEPTKNTLRSPLQSQWGKCKKDKSQKDYIITNFPLQDYEIKLIDNSNIIEKSKKYIQIPNTKHPFDHYTISIKL